MCARAVLHTSTIKILETRHPYLFTLTPAMRSYALRSDAIADTIYKAGLTNRIPDSRPSFLQDSTRVRHGGQSHPSTSTRAGNRSTMPPPPTCVRPADYGSRTAVSCVSCAPQSTPGCHSPYFLLSKYVLDLFRRTFIETIYAARKRSPVRVCSYLDALCCTRAPATR